MTETDWLRYFRANSAEPQLPWNDGYRLSGAERTVVIESIQQFQLGENARGGRLLARARSLGARYEASLRLFIQEEQRHSSLLAKFLAVQGERCLGDHWLTIAGTGDSPLPRPRLARGKAVHSAFRRLRGFAGLETRMRVLSTAEVLAIPYYTALGEATGSALLKSICERILREEAQHLRFQAFTFQRTGSRRPGWIAAWIRSAHRVLLISTTLLVWAEHRLVFRAGGYSLRRLWAHSSAEGEKLLRTA